MGVQYICEVSYDGMVDEDSYLRELPVVKYLERKNIVFEKPVSFFVGENGSGKSTLLEAIAVSAGFNAEGGTKNFRFATNETHSELYCHLTLAKKAYEKDGFFLRAESIYNMATDIDIMDAEPSFSPPVINSYGGISLHEQSHGESFLAIVQNRFGGNGLYILDEPEAALSPMRLLTLMSEIGDLVKKDSQFIIATHSPMLMAFPGADVFELSGNGIEKVDYRETEHFRLTRDFLNDPDRMLHYLLGQSSNYSLTR